MRLLSLNPFECWYTYHRSVVIALSPYNTQGQTVMATSDLAHACVLNNFIHGVCVNWYSLTLGIYRSAQL
ncbi:hypothetical protein QCA50_004216 [Cerrena zonata]|uniref:Uncharacterized protein n=1 Tax=Cerrena zonata TaxID=2478898 RepID=A0AAW0GGP6_9APHY